MTQSEISAAVAKVAQLAKESNPLTPSITNTVTINFVANAQLAVGGSAAMVYLPDEGAAMAKIGAANCYLIIGRRRTHPLINTRITRFLVTDA